MENNKIKNIKTPEEEKQEKELVNDLRGKTPEEVIDIYSDIALKSEYLKAIWSQTGDYDTAMEVYKNTNGKSGK